MEWGGEACRGGHFAEEGVVVGHFWIDQYNGFFSSIG
jgi:hypothetical protein